MTEHKQFEVIIVGGSYSGLSAGMALGRALKSVLIIDNGEPCNRQTPHSHNFITQDGKPPAEIAALARQQVQMYKTVAFFTGLAVIGRRTNNGFEIQVASGEKFRAQQLVFASGVRDIMPDVPGYAACWGISVLHCPYCHGYEWRNQKKGILGNGEYGYELARLISNWTDDLTLFTNGPSTLTAEQVERLEKHHIKIVTKEVDRLKHINGLLQNIIFRNGTKSAVKAIYARSAFEQHCPIPEALGCKLTEEGYIKVDLFQETTVKGVYACGDTATRMRTVAHAVAMGTAVGITVSKKMIFEEF